MTNDVFENNKSNISLLLKLIDSYRQEQSLAEYDAIQGDVKNGNWQTVKTSHGNTFFVDKQKYQDMNIIKNMEHRASAPGWQGVSALHTHSISHTQKKSIYKSDNFDIEQ